MVEDLGKECHKIVKGQEETEITCLKVECIDSALNMVTWIWLLRQLKVNKVTKKETCEVFFGHYCSEFLIKFTF